MASATNSITTHKKQPQQQLLQHFNEKLHYIIIANRTDAIQTDLIFIIIDLYINC